MIRAALLLLLAAPAQAAEGDDIWRWIWRERAELRAERATRTEQTMRIERPRDLSPVERREAERQRASRLVARRALERQQLCGPLPARVRVGATTEPARVLRDGDRIWIDTDRDGRYDAGEPVLVVEE